MGNWKLAITISATALLVGCASAPGLDRGTAQIGEFGAWDRDGNGQLNSHEWDAGFERSGIFEIWDRDRDRDVDPSEWATGPVEWYAENIGYRFDWDWDDDGRIDEREFSNALFEAWDEDENLRLDEDEFETGVNAL